MASYNKFEDFAEQLGKGVHQLHSAGHEFRVYLTNEQPLAADTVTGDCTSITAQNGYTPTDITNDYTESGGTGTMTAVDVEWTATGGSFGPFRWVVIFNYTSTNKNLLAWWDYGSEISCNTGEKFKVDFGASLLTIA